jgi:hypothetical protein
MAAAHMLGLALYLVFLFAVYIAIAIANGYLAARLDRNVAAWVILSLIPFVNVFFYIYAFYTVLFFVVDRLKPVGPAARS